MTVSVNNGVYSFGGTASAVTDFYFELPKPYTIPRPQDGGVLYLWNNAILSAYVEWYDANHNRIDAWSFMATKNRRSATYVLQSGHTVKYVRVRVNDGVNVDGFSFAPMFTEDGVSGYTRFYPYVDNVYLPHQ